MVQVHVRGIQQLLVDRCSSVASFIQQAVLHEFMTASGFDVPHCCPTGLYLYRACLKHTIKRFARQRSMRDVMFQFNRNCRAVRTGMIRSD